MNYKESVEYIHSLLVFGIKPGLERIGMLLNLIGNPQDKIKTVHVAGTNGKGSTSTMIANCLTKSGKKTGLFTSPYVLSFCERIQIDNENISEDNFAKVCTFVKEKIGDLNKKNIIITEFEAITAIAFLYFYNSGCEYAVVEVGLGGRFDATNIIKHPEAIIITSISLDHTAILGDTIEKIAYEKSGIIKEQSNVVTSKNQKKEVISVIDNKVLSMNSKLLITEPKNAKVISHNIYETKFIYNGNEYITKLAGRHQIENAVNVIETCNMLGIDYCSVFDGIKSTKMLARMEIIGENPLIIRDGGHNEGCSLALNDYLESNCVHNIIAVIGMMADKDVESYIKNIGSLCDKIITTKPSNPRAMTSYNLASVASKYCDNVEWIDNPKKAYKKALVEASNENTILVCGSFYLMSDIF